MLGHPLVATFAPVQSEMVGCINGVVPHTGMALEGMVPGSVQGCAISCVLYKQMMVVIMCVAIVFIVSKIINDNTIALYAALVFGALINFRLYFLQF